MRTRLFYYTILFTIFSFFACNKEESVQPTASNGSNITININGRILDGNQTAIIGATIRIGGKTTFSINEGVFQLQNVSIPKERAIIEVEKTGYWKKSFAFIPTTGDAVLNIFLMEKQFNKSVSATSGGTISIDNFEVDFPANAFVNANGSTYNGTVFIAMSPLPVGLSNFNNLIPGGDLLGRNVNDEEVILYSYGMLGIELTDNANNKLQLAPGILATVKFPIDPTQLSSAPSTIPLWHFDEVKNIWIEEGSANRSGNQYIGTVSHFSWWNVDALNSVSYVEGYVKNCFGTPVSGAAVLANGLYGVYTDANGYYHSAVPTLSSISLQALGFNSSSQIENINSSGVNTTVTVNDLIIPCSNIGYVSGTVTDCEGAGLSGSIYISDSQGNLTYLSVNNGVYSGVASCGQYLAYLFVSGSNTGNGNINIDCLPDTTTIPNIIVCDSTIYGENIQYSFSLGLNPFVYPLTFNDTNFYFDNNIAGNALYYELAHHQLTFNDTIFNIDGFIINAVNTYISNSTTPTFGFTGTYIYNGNILEIIPTSGITNVTQAGFTGDTTEFEYSGNVSLIYNDTNFFSSTATMKIKGLIK